MIAGVVEKAKAEQAKTPMGTEEMLRESARLSSSGARRAMKLGVEPKDIDQIVHDPRNGGCLSALSASP